MDIQALRQETPGAAEVLHLNNAGAALMPPPVINAIKNHIDLEAKVGGYEACDLMRLGLNDFYVKAAELIHADPAEIGFAESATRAWEMIFYSLSFKKGDRIMTCVAEYCSNYLAFLQRARVSGIEIVVIPNDEFGQLDLNNLREQIDERVKLIAIPHIPSQGGLIQPVEEVGKIARLHQIPYLLDATQSVGQMPVDVTKIGCDFLCATGRKFLRGPRGVGFLYVSRRYLEACEPPFIGLHCASWVGRDEYILRDDAQRFEGWEQNIAGKLGLRAAIDYALKLGLPAIWERVQILSQQLRQQLKGIDDLCLQDMGQNQCGIVTFTHPALSAAQFQAALCLRKINVAVSSKEYAYLDFSERNLKTIVRASVHYYNTEQEISHFCQQLTEIIQH